MPVKALHPRPEKIEVVVTADERKGESGQKGKQ